MPTHREIHKQLEEFSAKLVKIVRPSAVLLGPGDPNRREPDFLFRDGERIIGIEATTASYSNDFLKNDFYIHSHPEELREKMSMPLGATVDAQLLDSIQERIDSKLGKTYDGCDELIICVYVHAPNSSEDEVRYLLQKVSLPVSKLATSVYAYCYTSDGYFTKKLR